MFTTIIATAASVVTFISVVILGQSTTIHTNSHPQSTHIATILPTATASATPTPSAEEIRQQVQVQIDQATSAAKQQIDEQRQEALSQIEQQFSQAHQQLEQARLGLPVPSGQPNPLDVAGAQLDAQKQQAIDTINHSLQWPLP